MKTIKNLTADEIRKSILQLAIQGKLVKQDPSDEPASELVKKIFEEKKMLTKEGMIKKDNNESYIYKGADNSYYEKIGNKVKCIDDEIPFEIPNTWTRVKINTVSFNVGSKLNQIKERDILEKGLIPVISQSEKFICGYCNDKDKKIHDLPLIMFGDHTRNVKYIDFEFVIGADGTKLFKILLCNPKYIYYWMMFETRKINKKGYSRHYKYLKDKLIPIPPLDEQNKICSKLEILSKHINIYNSIEYKLTELESKLIEHLKTSILYSAIKGQLVKQNPTDEAIIQLSKRINEEKKIFLKENKTKLNKNDSYIYKADDKKYYEKIGNEIKCIDDEVPFVLPENWTWIRISSFSTIYTGNSINKDEKIKNYTNITDGYDYIATKDIGFDHSIKYDNGIKIPYKTTFKICPKNKILLCIEGGSAGKKIAITEKAVCFGNKLLCFNTRCIEDKYFYFYLQSQIFKRFFNDKLNGIIDGVNKANIKNILVPLPTIEEQKMISNKLISLFDLILK